MGDCCETPDEQMLVDALSDLPRRLTHSRTVARAGEDLARRNPSLPDYFVEACLLHDVGYGSHLVRTGFHPVDGASHLAENGCCAGLVELVAHHTGAEYEAAQRSLEGDLESYPKPDQKLVDAITLCDLTSGPTGDRVSPIARIEEILSRYEQGDPVHRAITQSRPYLIDCCRRAKLRFDLPDVWLGAPLQEVADA